MNQNELTERYQERIHQLLEKLKGTERLAQTRDRTTIDGCFQGAVGILDSLYGPNSPQVKALLEAKKASAAYSRIDFTGTRELRAIADSVKGTLLNIREELETGLIRSIETKASGVVIADLVVLAKAELRSGYKDVAAVLAAVALEDAMKRKAANLGVNVEGKSLDAVLNALKAKSALRGAQVPIVSSYVKLRNSAMHADWQSIQEADVSSLIGFLEPFLLEHFK